MPASSSKAAGKKKVEPPPDEAEGDEDAEEELDGLMMREPRMTSRSPRCRSRSCNTSV